MHFHSKWFLACSVVMSLSAVPAEAGCLTPPASAEALDSFKNDPGGLLNRFPLGSGSMASEIRFLAASDAGVLGAVAGLVKNANDAQKSAIAAGLAQAALACRAQDPALALQIQEAVAGIDSDAVRTQFAAITGDTKTAAAGGGGGGGGGAAGGASGEGGQTGGANGGSNVYAGASRGVGSSFSGPSSAVGATSQTVNSAASAVSPFSF